MDSDRLTAARSLAERGWLPGIEADAYGVRRLFATQHATEADLHLAAHNEAMRRKWTVTTYGEAEATSIFPVKMGLESIWRPLARTDGTTTLSLLRALLAACEAQEQDND